MADERSAEYGTRKDKNLSDVQFEGMIACYYTAATIRALATTGKPS